MPNGKCYFCDGTGVDPKPGGGTCPECNGSGQILIDNDGALADYFRGNTHSRVEALETAVTDLTDKVNDIMDKCNDIKEVVDAL